MTAATAADPELEAMVAIARRAAERAAERYAEHLQGRLLAWEKAPGDPVTAADRELDALIRDELRERFPGATVISEESAPSAEDLDAMAQGGEVFFVDPIDGTRELIDKTGEFAVMVGLARQGRAVAGVIALPAEGLVLAGKVGDRAFLERSAGQREPMGVSATDDFSAATMLVSRAHPPPLAEALRHRLGIAQVVRCGSVGVKVARIACGQAELYLHAGPGIHAWDGCAAEAVLRAAGGRMTDLDGRAIDYRAGLALYRGLLASNGALHPGALSAVGWAEREAVRVSR